MSLAQSPLDRTLDLLSRPVSAPDDMLQPVRHVRPMRIVPVLTTLFVTALAGLLAWAMWDVYMVPPWTRDAAVRAYVVTETPEVSGLIVSLPVTADQFVHKGDLLMEIDPTDYTLAVSNAEAALEGARADLMNRRTEAQRRQSLSTLSTSVEEQQRFTSQAQAAEAVYKSDLANLARARVNLARTRIVSPVNGTVTNLQAQVGDYATAGQRALTVVNTESFWIDGYFEETQLGKIHIGDLARVVLMGYRHSLIGHVSGITRGIEVANAQSGQGGLASVNPVYTWIRLAQRVPVRIEIDHLPPEVTLVVGETATVQLEHAAGAERGK